MVVAVIRIYRPTDRPTEVHPPTLLSAAQRSAPHHTIERFNFPLEKQKTRQREDLTRRAASASLVRVWNVIHRRCRGAK